MAKAQVGEQYLLPSSGFPDPFTIVKVCDATCPDRNGAHVHMTNPKPNVNIPSGEWFEPVTDFSNYGPFGIRYQLVTPPQVTLPLPPPVTIGGGIMNWMPNSNWAIGLYRDKELVPAKLKRQVSHNGKTDWVDYDRLLDADDFETYKHRREV